MENVSYLPNFENEKHETRGFDVRERVEQFGEPALSDRELIQLILGQPEREELATTLLREAESLPALMLWTAEDFQRVPGVGRNQALRLRAVCEVARRANLVPTSAAPLLNRADLISDYMLPITRVLEVEKFWILCLNRKNRLKKRVEVTSGTATASLAHPREVFRSAIQFSATAIVCVHNHPSGDPSPSAADLQVTRQLREAARTVDIQLLDHVIIGTTQSDPTGVGYYSFRSAGLL